MHQIIDKTFNLPQISMQLTIQSLLLIEAQQCSVTFPVDQSKVELIVELASNTFILILFLGGGCLFLKLVFG